MLEFVCVTTGVGRRKIGFSRYLPLLGTLYGLTRVARGSAVSETRDIDCGHE